MNGLTEIQKFYSEKTIFITGGTGFIGQCLVEKLLRSCFVKTIILIVRTKRRKSFEQRTAEYFNDPIFTNVKARYPKNLKQVEFVNGDISLDNFGLSLEDHKLIIERTNIVFHVAATVKFMSPLHEVVPLNIMATRTMVAMAKEMKSLEALVHVSTAYAFCHMDKIDETIQHPLCKPEFLIELIRNMKQEHLDQITPILLGNLPNTYILTKQAAESLIYREDKHLPVSIYRPAVVCPIYREPLPGWTNSRFGSSGIGIAIGMGAVKVLNFLNDIRWDLVPVDIVVNCMVAVAWNTALHKETGLKIYNHYTEANAISSNKSLNAFVSNDWPSACALRHPGYRFVKSKWMYKVYGLFIHAVPNVILDVTLQILGINTSWYKKCCKSNIMMNSLKYFFERNFNFGTKNIPALWNKLTPEDQQIFKFDSHSICWDEYVKIFARGTKEFILKEDMSKIEEVKFKHKILRYYEYFILSLYTFLILSISYIVYSTIW